MIDFSSNFGHYTPINAKSRDNTIVTVKGVASYDITIVQEHYVLKDIDRDFVYRQLKAICEAEIGKHYGSEMKQSSDALNKIKYNMDRVGITVNKFELEVH